MKQRAISAVIFTIVMLGGVFGGGGTFYLLFLLITGGCLWELMGILFQNDPNSRIRKITGAAVGIIPFAVFGSKVFGTVVPLSPGVQFVPYVFTAELADNASPILSAILFVMLAFYVLLIIELFLKAERPFSAISQYLLGVAYVGVPFTLLISIAFWDEGYAPLRVLGLLLLNWTNDTMAYMVGSRIGKSPFFSRISPKKTWEGTLGGIVFTFLVAFALSYWIKDFTLPQWLLLAGVVGVFGTLGDLVESMLKRSVQIKDSGSILPGHGGFLDRFDSFIIVLPFAWLALMLFEG